jgi:hypothetical protein
VWSGFAHEHGEIMCIQTEGFGKQLEKLFESPILPGHGRTIKQLHYLWQSVNFGHWQGVRGDRPHY